MNANPGTPERVRHAPGPEIIAAWALSLFGVIAVTVTVVAVVESYSNLLAFARDHGLSGWRLAIAPAAVDSFIIMGELLLFAAILMAWKGWSIWWLGGGMVLWGFLLSVGGNVWHAASAAPVDRAVAAIWPVTATAGLAGGLIIIKRIMAVAGTDGKRGTVALPAENVPADKTPPPARPHREPRRAVTGQREARVPGNGLAAASSPDDEARREARREAGRRAAAIRWGKQPEVTLAGPVNGNGGSHGGGS